MKTKITTLIIAALAVVSICLADSVGSSSKADDPAAFQEIHAEVRKMHAEFQQAVTRIGVLEKQVSTLQKSNAKLEEEVKNFGRPRLVPLEHK